MYCEISRLEDANWIPFASSKGHNWFFQVEITDKCYNRDGSLSSGGCLGISWWIEYLKCVWFVSIHFKDIEPCGSCDNIGGICWDNL